MALTKVSSALFEGDSPTFTELATLTGTTPQLDFKQTSGAHILASVRAEVDSGTGGKLVISTKRDGDSAVDRLTIDDDGAATFSGSVTATSLDISGNIDVDGTTNLDVVDIDGAVDMASTLAVAGVVTANAGVVVDNFTLDGTTLALSSGDMTLDVAGDINLDSDSGYVLFKDAGTEHARIYQNNSGDVNIASQISDKDIKFNGNDGGVGITALRLDMSAAGEATFNSGIRATSATINSKISIYTDSNGAEIDNNSGNFTIDTPGDIILDADGGGVYFKDGGTEIGLLANTGNNFVLMSRGDDKDIIFKGKDGSSVITALTLDMSAAGAASFNSTITIPDYVIHSGNTSTKFGFGSANTMNFISNGSDRLTIANSYAVFNEAGTDYDFRVEAVNQTHALFVEGSSGNVLVGTTDDAAGAGNTATGISLRGGTDNRSFFSAGANYAMHLNRNTSDGEILYFAKNGTAVGSIKADAGSIGIGSGDCGLLFYDAGNRIIPRNGTGTSDNALDLGAATDRFKNFYLSGGMYIGGTGGANRFDDYEEGTWTPVTGPTSTTATYAFRSGYYTKVGNLVTCTFGLLHNGGVWTGGEATISGLPFTVDTTGSYQEPQFIVSAVGALPTGQGGSSAGGAFNIGEVSFYCSGTQGRGRSYVSNSDTVMGGTSIFATNSFIKATIIYHSS